MDKDLISLHSLLDGRTALVTGSGRGIGAATAEALARAGANVIVNYIRNDQAASSVVARIKAFGGNAIKIRADVTDRNDVQNLRERTAEFFGSVDTLVLNANGMQDRHACALIDHPIEDLTARVSQQLSAVLKPCRTFLPDMVKAKYGCIIVISSGLSQRPLSGFASGCIAKAAIDAVVRSLGLELGEFGVRVNAIAPGVIATDLGATVPKEIWEWIESKAPLRRVGQAVDVAGAVLLLASDAARYITSTYLPVAGGLHTV